MPQAVELLPGTISDNIARFEAEADPEAVIRAAEAAGLSKSVTVHTLRHSFATHLLEQGVDIRVIQDLLGHRNIKTTAGYARVAVDLIRQVQSPLEHLDLAAIAPD